MMFQRFIVLSALGCVFVPAVASAQLPFSRQGEYYYREQMQRYQPPVVVNSTPAATAESSRAFYPSTAMQDRVQIQVTTPAQARISFDGKGTMQTGSRRQFVSPSLAAGDYTYEITASWMDDGKEVTQRKTFPVHPGDVVQISITRDGVQVTNAD
jgi:uncharacterized protein (TIGR03000 family)